MKADKMTHPKIERHGEQWRYKKRIPGDVLPHFNGSKFLTFTTKTADQRTARAECVRWLADHEARFQMLRQMLDGGSSVPARSGLSLVEVGAVLADEAARFKAEKLAADELTAESGDMGLGVMSPEFRLSIIGIDPDSARLAVQGFPDERAPFEALALRRMAGVGVPLEESSGAARSAAMAFARASLEVAEVVRLRAAGGLDSTPNPLPRPALVVAPVADRAPLLSAVLADFMGRHDPEQPIMKKYRAVLPMFAEVVGDGPVSELRQKAVSEFFDLIQKLPPRWADKRKQLGKTVQELAAMAWPECMAEKTFDDTYKMAVRSFFKFARLTYGDAGWPDRLTTEGIKYRGEEEEGKNRQRPMLLKELQRLFNGPEAAAFAADTSQASAFWLPLLGLYTGARINELCQLNPQCDIRNDDPQAPGVWFLDITEEGEAAEGVDKSVKNEISQRRVPVHSALLALGFVEYVQRLKKAGSALLFPLWAPSKGRAAGGAEKWFRGHLEALGLRDETRGARLVGFHAFRSTFMARAEEINEPRADAISGHAREGESKVKRNYRRETPLSIEVEILERITFDVSPPMPVKPPG
ncbi:MAG: site-specific integrase [Zoogloea sp.]|nr:site-specific integrase [Zoogloea sp.]